MCIAVPNTTELSLAIFAPLEIILGGEIHVYLLTLQGNIAIFEYFLIELLNQ